MFRNGNNRRSDSEGDSDDNIRCSNLPVIKEGLILRYKRRYLASSWAQEWLVLYEDSTLAWYKDPSGKRCPHLSFRVRKSADTFAVSNWTSQIPWRPKIPLWAEFEQLMAVGPHNRPHKVIWMIATSKNDMQSWLHAISSTLPPPPYLELRLNLPHIRKAFECPLMCIRPATGSELANYDNSTPPSEMTLTGKGLVATLKKEIPLSGNLGRLMEWGQGWGWVTVASGAWNGRLTWHQDGENFTLFAAPICHFSNCGGGGEAVPVDAMASQDHTAGQPVDACDVAGPSGMCDTVATTSTAVTYDDYTVDSIDFCGMDCDFMF